MLPMRCSSCSWKYRSMEATASRGLFGNLDTHGRTLLFNS